jgi:hypothetical protein
MYGIAVELALHQQFGPSAPAGAVAGPVSRFDDGFKTVVCEGEGGQQQATRAQDAGDIAAGRAVLMVVKDDLQLLGLIALFSSSDHLSLRHRQLTLQRQWGVWLIAASLPFVLSMLNWRRDPAREMRLKELEKRSKQLEKELALLDWIHSELDLIEADSPSSSTPSAGNRRKLQRLLSPLNRPEMADLFRA